MILCFMFLFLFVCLVLFLSILKNSFVLFCFCVVVFCHKTKWSSCLHLVVLHPFLFLLFCFEFYFFCCFHSSQKRTPQKTRHSKNPKKTKMQKNQTKKKSVSAVVFTDSVLKFFGVGLKISLFG